MDRFDLLVRLHREPVRLQSSSSEKSSEEIRKNVMEARRRQQSRFSSKQISLNSGIKAGEVKEYCRMDSRTEELVTSYANRSKLSMRSFHNILKLSRTVADLNRHETIAKEDILEAFTYRVQPTSPLV